MLKNKLVIGKFSDMVKQAPRFKKSENAQICFPQKIVIYMSFYHQVCTALSAALELTFCHEAKTIFPTKYILSL